MNWLDIVIACIVVVFTTLGYRKGFLRRLLGLAGIILGFILAVKFYKTISGWVSGILKSNITVTQVICFLLIIIIVFSLAVWIARFIAGMNAGTSMVDKVLGTILGFAEGVLIASVLLVSLSHLNIPDNRIKEQSILYSSVYGVAPLVFDKVISLSPELQKVYEEYKKTFL